MSRVTWRGVTVDRRTADMLDEVARLSGSINVRPTQGSYSGSVAASAGTHSGCGAVDIITGTPADMRRLVGIMRRVGFAAWLRTPAQSSWPYHVHAIAVQKGGKGDRGCLSSGAHAQVVDYYNGLNGLAGRGRDDGPRTHVGTTWETYRSGGTPGPDNSIRRFGMFLAKSQHGQWFLVGPTSARHVELNTYRNLRDSGVPVVDKTLMDETIRDLADLSTAAGGVAAPGADRKRGRG